LSCGHKKNSSLVPVMFFLAGVTITYAVNFINQPKTAWRLDAMLPGNVFSSYALGECSDNIDDEPWINLKRQIDDFEFRIKDVESKGGYLTLSEIKTLVHKMQIGILQIEKPLSSQLNSIYNKIINGEEIEPLSLEIINDRVRKINCTLSGIHAELDS
ncbi:TPA: VasL domain-containing protein, partial [Escherichia coli]